MIRFLIIAIVLVGCRTGEFSTDINDDFKILQEFKWHENHLNSNIQKIQNTRLVLSVNESDDNYRVFVTNLNTGEQRGFVSVADLESVGIIGDQGYSIIRGNIGYTISPVEDNFWFFSQRNRIAVLLNKDGLIIQKIDLSEITPLNATRFFLNQYETIKFSLALSSKDYLFSNTKLLISDNDEVHESIIKNNYMVNEFPLLEPTKQRTMVKRIPVVVSNKYYGYVGFRYSSQLFKFSVKNNERSYEYLLQDPFGTGFPEIIEPTIGTNPDGSERRIYMPIVGNQTPYTIDMAIGDNRLYVLTNGLPLPRRLQRLAPFIRTLGGEPDMHIMENSGETLLVYDTETNELIHSINLPFTAFGLLHSDKYLYFSAIFNGEPKLLKTKAPL